ncbi:MAG: helix-turn-helix transcriptional regulator [Ruminococcus sp.]|nr:helix-turn-helix transcriptional regulator [Ruminococcus sp.]
MTDMLPDATKCFCENLLKYRKRANLTQTQIAELLGINRTTYTKYETGVCEPSLQTIEHIAEIFGTDINTLFFEGRNETPAGSKTVLLTEAELDIVMDIRQLSDSDRHRLQNSIKKNLRKNKPPKKES